MVGVFVNFFSQVQLKMTNSIFAYTPTYLSFYNLRGGNLQRMKYVKSPSLIYGLYSLPSIIKIMVIIMNDLWSSVYEENLKIVDSKAYRNFHITVFERLDGVSYTVRILHDNSEEFIYCTRYEFTENGFNAYIYFSNREYVILSI